jgi:hypothetical protein
MSQARFEVAIPVLQLSTTARASDRDASVAGTGHPVITSCAANKVRLPGTGLLWPKYDYVSESKNALPSLDTLTYGNSKLNLYVTVGLYEPWIWLSSGLLCRVVWQKFTTVSEVLAASITRAHRRDDGGRKQAFSYSPSWEPQFSHILTIRTYMERVNVNVLFQGYSKRKVIPLHAMEAHGGRGGIAPTHS